MTVSKAPLTADEFLNAIRSGATADGINAMLAMFHEHRRRSRVARIERMSRLVAARITGATPAVEVAVETLLKSALELLGEA